VSQSRTVDVAVVEAANREQGVWDAVELLADLGNPFEGKHVVLKPNFNSEDEFPGSTHNEMLEILIGLLQEMKASEITIADRSGGGRITADVLRAKGIPGLAEDMGVHLVATDRLPASEWVKVGLLDSHWTRGIEVPKLFRNAEALLQTCCLKTHQFGGGFTMSLKNAVGIVAKTSVIDGYDYMKELHASPYQQEMIAEINLAYQPDLIVMDALEAFIRGGPATGERAYPRLVVASTDRVAVDAVGVAILRQYDTTPDVARGPIFELPQIRHAAELGLGVTSVDQIRLVSGHDLGSRQTVRRLDQLLRSGAE